MCIPKICNVSLSLTSACRANLSPVSSSFPETGLSSIFSDDEEEALVRLAGDPFWLGLWLRRPRWALGCSIGGLTNGAQADKILWYGAQPDEWCTSSRLTVSPPCTTTQLQSSQRSEKNSVCAIYNNLTYEVKMVNAARHHANLPSNSRQLIRTNVSCRLRDKY